MGIFINDQNDNNKYLLDTLSESSIQCINEVYFGKTKELLEIEQQLDVFRNKYMEKYVLNMKVNSDMDLLKFDRMMEDYFGFGCFTLHIHNMQEANAFTMPIDYRYDYKNPRDNIIADKNGFKFKKEFDYACILGIFSGVIFNPEFSTQEIMALILHEVGHNFNSAINKSNGAMVNTYITTLCVINFIAAATGNISGLINIITGTNKTRMTLDKMGKNMREQNYFPVIIYDAMKQILMITYAGIKSINDISRILSLGFQYVYNVLIKVINIPLKILSNPLNIILKPFGVKVGYRSEESADNFATMYGYGGELSSALQKLEGTEGESSSKIMKAFNKLPVISSLMHLVEAPALILLSIFDSHPNTVIRVKDQIALLEAELNKADIDPKMYNVIKQDIKVCEEALDALIDTSKGLDDPYIGKKAYNNIIKNCKIKQIILGDKFKFKEYDEVFKDKNR